MRLSRRFPVEVVVIALMSALLVGGAASGTTNTLTSEPVADATIRMDRPTTSYGTAPDLLVDGSPIRDSLLRFPVSGVGGDVVTHASLRLFVVDSSSQSGTVYRVNSQTWTEAVTWATAPAAEPQPIATLGKATLGTWVDFDVTSLVTGDGMYSVRIASTSTNGVDYVSRQGPASQRPQLVVTTTPSDDSTPPTVSIDAPEDGSEVSGQVSLAVSASDDVGVSEVEIAVDAAILETDTGSPYEAVWDTTLETDGSHELTALAHDAAGNATTSAPIVVTVSNVVDDPPPPSPSPTPSPPATPTSFTFAAAGDHGANTRTTASLAALDASPASFYLALGDLDYDETPTDAGWCDYVYANLPSKGSAFPFEVVAGNHEEDGAVNGSVLNHAACLPDRLGATVGPGSTYGAEYAFDYPADTPLARFIMISPGLTVGGLDYDYEPGTANYAWLASEIDDARAAGIEWVVVGMHFPCLSAGNYQCGAGTALMNLLVDRRVDLILHGHDHTYQRSKQLALDPVSCTAIPASGYLPGCVVDDGSDGVYPKGTGSVDVVAGTFGRGLYSVSTTDSEAPYFAKLDGTSNGFVEYTVSETRIDAAFVRSSGALSDTFSIVSGAAPSADLSPPSQPAGLQADTSVPGRVGLSWAASTDDVGVSHYAVFRDGAPIGNTSSTSLTDAAITSGATYTYAVSAFDAAGNPSALSAPVIVSPPTADTMTFEPDADATIRPSNPTTNYGSSASLEVDSSSRKDFLMRFTVTGVGNRTVTSAKIRLACADSSPRGGDFAVTSSTGWTEPTVTWDNAPVAGAPVTSLLDVVSGSTYEVDLSSVIQGDGTYTLRVSSPNSNGADYASKEAVVGSRPQLILTTSE